MIGGRLEAFFTVPSAATVTASNSGGASTSVSLTAGSYTPTSFVAHLVARLNTVRTPANWSGSISTGASGTGLVTLNCTGTWDLTFTTATAGTILGFVGNIASRSTAATGTQNARGLWLPDCPLWLEQSPSMAPKVTDNRATEGPTGQVVTLGGTKKYVHKNLRWSHVPVQRIKESSATTVYASLQQWIDDTQLGDGHTWFSRGSLFQIYWSNAGTDTLVGADLNSTLGWALSPAISDWSEITKRVDQAWDGMWSVEFARIVTAG